MALPMLESSKDLGGGIVVDRQSELVLDSSDIAYLLDGSTDQTRNTAPRRPRVFCDQGCIIEDVLSAPANRNWIHKVFSLFNP